MSGRTHWRCAGKRLALDRPLIMGVVNVTPDSFSDGGLFLEADQAIAQGLALAAAGADLLDIGGESSRPGALPVSPDIETGRVIPVIKALAKRLAIPISVDTTRTAVARHALAAGASIINDISAGHADPGMLPLAAREGPGLVLMHMRGTPRTMQTNPQYDDVVREVRDRLAADLSRAREAGVAAETLAVDPGIGFGKTTRHNLALLANLDQLASLGHPLLIGLSRKRFLGELTGRPVTQRLPAGLAAMVWCVLRGAAILRVHDVAETRDALTVLSALREHRMATENQPF